MVSEARMNSNQLILAIALGKAFIAPATPDVSDYASTFAS